MEAITIHRKNPQSSKKYSLPKIQQSHFRNVWKAVEVEAEMRWTAMTRQMDCEAIFHVKEAALLWHNNIESRYQVSAILLRLGVNTPDHSRLFRRLNRHLTKDITPHVVRLRSAACPNMRTLMQQLTRRLFQKKDPVIPGPLRLSFHSVTAWYREYESNSRPIVILLEDCESLPPKLLQDFVTVSSVHAANLPIIFVLGLASHPAVLHGLLGSLAASRLRLTEVKGPGAASVRRRVLEPLLLPSPRCLLGMGSRIRNLLIDAFSRLDLSAASFLRRLRLCFLEHALRCSKSELETLSSASSGKIVSENLHRCLKTSEWFSKLFHVELRHAALSSVGLAESDHFRDALTQWLRLPSEKLISDVKEKFDNNADDVELTRIVRNAVEQDDDEEKESTSVVSSCVLRQGKMSLQQLQAGLKAMNAEKQRPAEQLKQRLKHCLEEIAHKFCPILDCPVPVFDEVESIRALLNPTQRADLQIALSRPSVYLLGDRIDVNEATSLNHRLPDLSILYKLHLECPHFINLYDWLQAFAAVLGEKGDGSVSPSSTIQSRFALCVSELQFLGLIKPTARKTDHVVRLTWGSC